MKEDEAFCTLPSNENEAVLKDLLMVLVINEDGHALMVFEAAFLRLQLP